MTPEGKIEAYLRQQVRASGGRVRKLKWIGRNGAPDDFIWWPGHPPQSAFVECKTPLGRLSKVQQVEIGQLRKDGFKVWIVRSKEDVDHCVAAMTLAIVHTRP